MKEEVTTALNRGIAFLLAQQCIDGRFEGQLSSSTFPSCAYAWVQLAQGETPAPTLRKWFLQNQNADGRWSLDTSTLSNPEATRFVHLILQQIHKRTPSPALQKLLATITTAAPNLALIKLAYAAFNQFDWNKLTVPEKALPVMKLARQFTKIPILGNRLKPPRHRLPPVAFFKTPLFDTLFIAEQHTLVPIFILIELNTAKRPEMIEVLVAWLKAHVLSDGSWFRVNYITALSVLALSELREKWRIDYEIATLIDRGTAWLDRTRNPDGGCREALNLNVWDTALSGIALTEEFPQSTPNESLRHELLNRVHHAAQWLIEHQNTDGGWAFSGLIDSTLPSDADDTALATLALTRVGNTVDTPPTNNAIHRGIKWLTTQQAENGSWSTYQPGRGDVGCVSITAHAIEALLAAKCEPTDTPVDTPKAVHRGIQWIQQQIHKDGYWRDLWLAKDTYGTACALTALVKAGYTGAPEIAQGIKWLENTQNPDGGWGEDMFANPTDSTVEQTAWSSYALLRVDPKNHAAQNGIRFLLEHQRQDGSWPEHCVGIYWEIIGGYADSIYASVFPILALKRFLTTTV